MRLVASSIFVLAIAVVVAAVLLTRHHNNVNVNYPTTTCDPYFGC